MKTIKVIDLLNMIANGEEVPTIIKYKHKIWTYRNDVKDYTDETQFFFGEYIFQDDTQKELNDEVEIIEEDKKIKRIQSCGDNLYSEYIGEWLVNKENYTEYDELLMNKINEIIDYINKEEK